jgi:hypothetical protein
MVTASEVHEYAGGAVLNSPLFDRFPFFRFLQPRSFSVVRTCSLLNKGGKLQDKFAR